LPGARTTYNLADKRQLFIQYFDTVSPVPIYFSHDTNGLELLLILPSQYLLFCKNHILKVKDNKSYLFINDDLRTHVDLSLFYIGHALYPCAANSCEVGVGLQPSYTQYLQEGTTALFVLNSGVSENLRLYSISGIS
jgi:hypothetical protein